MGIFVLLFDLSLARAPSPCAGKLEVNVQGQGWGPCPTRMRPDKVHARGFEEHAADAPQTGTRSLTRKATSSFHT